MTAEWLFRQFPTANEGDLSRYRAKLVSGATLADVAAEQALGDAIVLGPGELKSGGFRRRSTLADTFEAVIGAIYLDGGLEAARSAIETALRERVDNLPPAEELKDPKTRLQEFLQARQLGLPDYQIVHASGADHARRFLARCTVAPLDAVSEGEGTSRRKAEQAAAQRMLQQIRG